MLALVVVLMHAGLPFNALQPAVVAVCIFFIISGYAMSGLAESMFSPAGQSFGQTCRRFWVDRVLRLYPQYLFWLFAQCILIFMFQIRWFLQQGPLDWINVSSNLLVLPLSLGLYLPSLDHMFVLPHAWSLSTELGFYLLVPFLWRWPGCTWAAGLGGFVVFALATHGVMEPAYYGYRLLPGTLPFFIMGRALFLRHHALLGCLLVLMAADLASVWGMGHMPLGVNHGVFIAAFLGPLAVAVAAAQRGGAIDRLCGSASYGAYLDQLLVILLLGGIGSLPLRLAATVVASAALGVGSYAVVEVPVNRLRRRLRRKQAAVY